MTRSLNVFNEESDPRPHCSCSPVLSLGAQFCAQTIVNLKVFGKGVPRAVISGKSNQTPLQMIPQHHLDCPPWIYDSAFGIVHRYGCRSCHYYMRHVSSVDKNDDDYAHAISNREAELRNCYLDEYRRDRDAQRQRDDDLLKEYRSQRDSAHDSLLRSELKLKKAREKIKRLRRELLAYKATKNKLHTRPQAGGSGSDLIMDEELWDDGLSSGTSRVSLTAT